MVNETIQRDSSRGQRAYELKPGEVTASAPDGTRPHAAQCWHHPETQGVEGLAATAPVADKQRGLARIEELAESSAPNARIAAKEALAARDIAGMDDDVQPALAPDALRAVNWTGCKRSNT